MDVESVMFGLSLFGVYITSRTLGLSRLTSSSLTTHVRLAGGLDPIARHVISIGSLGSMTMISGECLIIRINVSLSNDNVTSGITE